ncbi:MAG: YbaN family protein [Rhodospirillaceae bacterium]|jgi:uncharacterized membrane protein YbaN (DUF454 family)
MASQQPLTPPSAEPPRPSQVTHCTLRWALLAFGWLNVALGVIGIIVPGMPTTVFLLIALWAFSKCSERFQTWLWNHKRLGPPVRAWHEHKVIPPAAKAFAVIMMTSSIVLVAVFVAQSWLMPTIMALIMLPIAFYIVTRASYVPSEVTVKSDRPA